MPVEDGGFPGAMLGPWGIHQKETGQEAVYQFVGRFLEPGLMIPQGLVDPSPLGKDVHGILQKAYRQGSHKPIDAQDHNPNLVSTPVFPGTFEEACHGQDGPQ